MEKEPSFKEAMERIEEIVDKMSDENLDIDEAIKLYEEGRKLLEYCRDKLESAELKIKNLTNIDEVLEGAEPEFEDADINFNDETSDL